MFQTHIPILRPLTTAHLAQTMSLLSLSVGELREQIETELASNPALEMIEERRCPVCHRIIAGRGACPVCSSPTMSRGEEAVIFVSPREEYWGSSGTRNEDYTEDELSASVDELPVFVLQQVAPDLDRNQQRIAAHLLTHLDEDGLLTIPLIEVASYFHIPVSKVEAVKNIIQHAEPVGVGSSNTTEALLVQLEVLAETKPVPELAYRMILEGADLLFHRQYNELARRMKVPFRHVQQAISFISDNLNPFPARSHWGNVRQPTISARDVYHQPDIVIRYVNDDPENILIVEIIMPIHGSLQVNSLFRKALREASEEKKEEWKNDIEKAALFVKCLQQRNNTMQRLMQRITAIQREYIKHGERYIKPLTRAQIAGELQVHESTISRAVANKTVALPNRRIIPLSSFFDRSLNARTILKTIIDHEVQPLSDADLVDLLAAQGIKVARRTIAKYRAMEGILPAHLRSTSCQHP